MCDYGSKCAGYDKPICDQLDSTNPCFKEREKQTPEQAGRGVELERRVIRKKEDKELWNISHV